MITLTEKALRDYGFQSVNLGPGWAGQSLDDSPRTWKGEYMGMIRRGIQLLAEKVQDGMYAINQIRVRKGDKEVRYKAEQLESPAFQGVETPSGLLTILSNFERLAGITEKTISLCYQIAHSDSLREAEPWIDEAYEEIRRHRDPLVKSRAEMEFEGAIEACRRHDPSRFEY